MDNLQLAVADFKTSQSAIKEKNAAETVADFEPEFQI
jgi:hypothetical protein